MNYALIHSNIPTAKGTIKPTQTLVHFGDTASTENGTLKSKLRFVKTGYNLSALK